MPADSAPTSEARVTAAGGISPSDVHSDIVGLPPSRDSDRVILFTPAMARILLIDDDDAVRSAISLILDQEGHAVAAAHDGQAGLDLLASAAFDLVMVDMFMPGLGGLETMARIRALTPNLPVIAISGAVARQPSTAADVLAAASATGATLVIQKPFRPRELLQAIATCLAATSPAAGTPTS